MKNRLLYFAAGALYRILGFVFLMLSLFLLVHLSELFFNTPTQVPLGSGKLVFGGDILKTIRVQVSLPLSDTTIRTTTGTVASWISDSDEPPSNAQVLARRRDIARIPNADTIVTRIMVIPPRKRSSVSWFPETVRIQNDRGEPGIAVEPRVREARAVLTLRAGTRRDRLLVALPSVVRFGLLLFALYQVRGFLKLFRKDQSLSRASFRRVRWLGYVFMGYALLPLVEYWAVSQVLEYADLYRYSTRGTKVDSFSVWISPLSEMRLDLLFAGILLLIVAAVFQRGHELQREAELTI